MMFRVTTSVQLCFQGSGQCCKERKENGKPEWQEKEEMRLSLFTDDGIVCIQNPKEYTVNYYNW
jgi:hypothetical protein